MSTLDTDEFDVTRPVEAAPAYPAAEPTVQPPAAPPTAPAPAPAVERYDTYAAPLPPITAPQAGEASVVYVPLAVTIGDGFKFGCGFFLSSAVVVAVLLVLLVLVGILAAATGASKGLPGI